MILIISKDNEITTTEVIKWLYHLGKNFIRVNEDEFFEIKMSNGKLALQSERNSFLLDDITSVWYRRGGIKFKRFHYQNDIVNIHMHETQHWLEDYVIHTLESKNHISKQRKSHVNKLIVLEVAQKVGLNVPRYFLADNTQDVKIGETIVKSITGNGVLQDIHKNYDGIMYTSVVHEEHPTNFFISFFQDKIEKDFEVRTFYLKGKIWSFAIISQNDEKTKVDFRKYNTAKPNRNVRYKLPADTEERVHQLMQNLDLDCGSIDFIKGVDGMFYFLEINTVGQFTALSSITNYSLEKEIAEYL
ncbi:ATP-GRASP peptide maturase, grasp-with-spasm system [Chryseobacterium wanjuense]|jgi:ATP-GRASP peptide maturase of grasp-with-spasm system|uniref:ATP-GRASP peptide maturase, grasp-with-spasm system n=1 Tax=Chryseobacterium wanjuense TaxID=356305 RepID=A0A1I0RD16_9FLAO|nr:grasp-with-spasm system ATP-grasp peptide maturase [Chryseobacterium wanjuense]SEW38744.1 ATP-GRASP peptide maturase, grasp-with-spasm system [Chryseobacterium wanjuense]